MGAITWVRAVRKVAGLPPQSEYPHLEALMEAEEGQMANDYRVLSWIIPPFLAVAGIAVFVPLALTIHSLFFLGPPACLLLACGLWFLFDRLDKSIPQSKQRLRKRSEKIWSRYRGLGNLVGVSPALSPSVAAVLDEAAAIYLKHAPPTKSSPRNALNTAHARAVTALEEAMARMLDLAEANTPQAQELELSRGWAEPMLMEMRELDRVLDGYLSRGSIVAGDALAGLREARMELIGIDAAIGELEQRH